MRLRRKRKSSTNASLRTRSESSPQASPKTESSNDPDSPSWRRPGQKRRNPFGCSPKKRIILERSSSDGGSGDPGSVLRSLCDINDPVEEPGLERSRDIDSLLSSREQVSNEADVQQVCEDTVVPGVKACGVDWSIKTKVRFISPNSFAWCSPMRTTDESAGLTAFAQALPDTVNKPVQDVGQCEYAKQELQKHTLYWQHPTLPWLRLVPRMVPDNKIGKPGCLGVSDDIQAALKSDWCDSFVSAFNQLRGGRCPYFYVCAHQFTTLFRASGVGGRPLHHALLSPTSRGLRESFRKEGIEFTMPLAEHLLAKGEHNAGETGTKDKTAETPSSVVKDGTDIVPDSGDLKETDAADVTGDDIMATDDGASSFLETLGLDSARYRSLDPSKIKIQREAFRMIDHRPESLVLVEGGDTQALFNFLLNCRSCMASSGVQAGIPPTLLAPTPFKGATLKSLNLKTGTVRQRAADSTVTLWHSLEVEGCLLPHSVHGLSQLLARSQHTYTASFSTHDASAALNAAATGSDVTRDDVTARLSKTGIQASHAESIAAECQLGKVVMRDMDCHEGMFTWST